MSWYAQTFSFLCKKYAAMDFQVWFIFAIVLCSSTASGVKKSKSKVKARLDALEHLFRGELYLMRENLETDRAQRQNLLKNLNETLELFYRSLSNEKAGTYRAEEDRMLSKFNETLKMFKIPEILKKMKTDRAERQQLIKRLNDTLEHLHISEVNDKLEREILMKKLDDTMEYIDMLIANTGNMSRRQTCIAMNVSCDNPERNNLELFTMNTHVEKNSNAIKEISEKIIRSKRGLSEEKKLRKNNFDDLVTRLTNLEQKQNKMIKAHEDLLNVANDINSTSIFKTTLDKLQNKTEILNQELNSQRVQTTFLRKSMIQRDHNTQKLSSSVTNIQQGFTSGPTAGNATSKPEITWSVRLVDGRGPWEGRLEINYNGRHGTVCDIGFDSNDARVVCKMLGYSPTRARAFNGPRFTSGHTFGEGTGEILLSWLACQGDEESLFSCRHRGIGVHSCNHGYDAGVHCQHNQ